MSVRTQDGKLDVELVSVHSVDVLPELFEPLPAAVVASSPQETSMPTIKSIKMPDKTFLIFNLHVLFSYFQLITK